MRYGWVFDQLGDQFASANTASSSSPGMASGRKSRTLRRDLSNSDTLAEKEVMGIDGPENGRGEWEFSLSRGTSRGRRFIPLNRLGLLGDCPVGGDAGRVNIVWRRRPGVRACYDWIESPPHALFPYAECP